MDRQVGTAELPLLSGDPNPSSLEGSGRRVRNFNDADPGPGVAGNPHIDPLRRAVPKNVDRNHLAEFYRAEGAAKGSERVDGSVVESDELLFRVQTRASPDAGRVLDPHPHFSATARRVS